MARLKRKSPPDSIISAEQNKRQKVFKPGSKHDANGNAMLDSDTGFYNDEEAWIQIYYTILSKKAALDANMQIPPTTDVLLYFNAYFQGFKEPVGSYRTSTNGESVVMECAAVPRRVRRTFKEFEAAVQRICPELKQAIDEMRATRSEQLDEMATHTAQESQLVITPENIQAVLNEAGKLDEAGEPDTAVLDNLPIPDDEMSDRTSWQNKAIARIDARGPLKPNISTTWHRDYEYFHWNPEDVPARSLKDGPQMVNRFEDAADANAIINTCPVPPLGYFGDLNKLKKKDFKEEVYEGAVVEKIEGKEVETVEEIKKRERKKHEEQVQLLYVSRKVAAARCLLAEWRERYGTVENTLSIKEVMGYLEHNDVSHVEDMYKESMKTLKVRTSA